MKKTFFALITVLTAAANVFCVSAADSVLEAKYNSLEKSDFPSKTNSYYFSSEGYPMIHDFSFKNGVFSGRIDDFDNDGDDELLVVYAKSDDKIDGYDTAGIHLEMYENKNGRAELAAKTESIEAFDGENGNGCVFTKNVNGSTNIFVQYSSYVGSFADGAGTNIMVCSYDGKKFADKFSDSISGTGGMTVSAAELKAMRDTGLYDSVKNFEKNSDGSYFVDTEIYNINNLEKNKVMIAEIEQTTTANSLPYTDDWNERLSKIVNNCVISFKLTDHSNIGGASSSASSDGITVLLNGKKMSFDEAPYIENGTTRVPMRAIFEALGAEVDYNASSKKITAVKSGTTVSITIGESSAVVNGKRVKLAVPAEIKNSRTMVPLRFVSEALGADVDWDGQTKTIKISN